MTAEKKHALLALHGAVSLFALSGLFAKWLELPATHIVFGRAVFAALAIAIILTFYDRKKLKCSLRMLFLLAVTGGVLAFHWGSFFHSIQISSVTIGLITFASFPIFVSLIEPLFFDESFEVKTIAQALLTFVGIYLVLPEGEFDKGVLAGATWGILSAISFAILTLMNRKFVNHLSAKTVALYQNAFAALFMLPLVIKLTLFPSDQQLMILVLLGVVFTALAHSLFNFSLKVVNAQTASIAVSLEPIYGIVAAYFLIGETLTIAIVLGGVIVLVTNAWALRNN